LVASWGHGRAGHVGGHPTPGLWMMGGTLSLLDRADDSVLAADLAACNAYQGAAAAAARIACPTLLLLGAGDRMTPPAKAKPIGAAIRQARTIVLPDAGRMRSPTRCAISSRKK
jgi:pimeloyl-ACP methyl ester carboxylesterase